MNGVLLLDACAVVMPAPFGVWDVCKGSDITDGAFIKMRGRNTRTARYRVFLFIVKAKMKFACFIYNKKHNIHLYSREADSLPYR